MYEAIWRVGGKKVLERKNSLAFSEKQGVNPDISTIAVLFGLDSLLRHFALNCPPTDTQTG
ncbi:TPA: hypothetical protein EYN98_20545 [Candidatus Poribacteria bacterium]|nr:hypothetical protein [Candidatus Poribacteria bacterium]HIA68391.1 hypothetical protein [Candidatus Poribacteria bacterium]HIB88437.1 hypothetical protein [Candidatus Poribacteria bacterium]HIB99816.1 hypothetical protein [Candidatus Poribacteria bacterium]HIN28446.1 hypothetical protein [Candidatus Poribacteria bacterium]